MANTRYRRGGAYAADMAVYARAMAADNSAQLSRVKRNLVRALREDVTPRQREVLLLYYAEQLNTRQIGEKLGVEALDEYTLKLTFTSPTLPEEFLVDKNRDIYVLPTRRDRPDFSTPTEWVKG